MQEDNFVKYIIVSLFALSLPQTVLARDNMKDLQYEYTAHLTDCAALYLGLSNTNNPNKQAFTLLALVFYSYAGEIYPSKQLKNKMADSGEKLASSMKEIMENKDITILGDQIMVCQNVLRIAESKLRPNMSERKKELTPMLYHNKPKE